MPTVVGTWRPLILVPASALAGLSVLQLEAVLAHELAHIRRHDYLVNLLQTLVETALFYHPAVWWLSARIREEREHCADDVAVESCGDVRLYSRTLATLEQLRVSVPAPAVGANGGSLLLRIQRLLAVPEGGAPLHPWRFAGSLVAATLLVVLGAARQAQATEPTSQPPAHEVLAPPDWCEPLLRFQAGMTRPEKLSGYVPRIPKSMLPPLAPPGLLVQMSVECTIKAVGTLTDCLVIDSRPELAEFDAEVLR
ncbi:MAG: M56 family metallopeptidase, partial [Archangium sp.]